MKKKADELGPDIRNVGYARVSTDEQNLDLQLDALRKAGVMDDNLHSEHVSGAAANRPQLDMAIKDLRPGDTFIVWRLDRLARSMRDLYRRLDEIFDAGASFKSLSENFDFTTAIGKLYIAIAGAFAEFERQLIRERTEAGMRAWIARGGKPGAEIKFTPKKQAIAVKMVREGRGVEAACQEVDVSIATFYGYYTVKTKIVGKGKKKRKIVTVKRKAK